MQVYLRPLGGADQKWPVSSEGGLHSIWSRDGKKIYYRSGQQMMVVDLMAAPDVRLSGPARALRKTVLLRPEHHASERQPQR